MPLEFSAGAVIFRKEKNKPMFLLLHYISGHWDFSKGHIEKDEKDVDTVIREVKEETGIEDLEFVDSFKEKLEYFFRKKGETIHKQVVYYLVETKTKEIKLSDEHIGFAWLDYKAALERLTFDNSKNILKKANELLKTLT